MPGPPASRHEGRHGSDEPDSDAAMAGAAPALPEAGPPAGAGEPAPQPPAADGEPTQPRGPAVEAAESDPAEEPVGRSRPEIRRARRQAEAERRRGRADADASLAALMGELAEATQPERRPAG